LFYPSQRDRLAFASEIPALLEVPGIDSRPDRQAIFDYAALFYIPEPETFYTDIRVMQPGELLEAQWDGHEMRLLGAHCWSITPEVNMTLEEAVGRTKALVTSAAKSCLVLQADYLVSSGLKPIRKLLKH
jgi:asparagine synthase (glutamine-hydrolysing)